MQNSKFRIQNDPSTIQYGEGNAKFKIILFISIFLIASFLLYGYFKVTKNSNNSARPIEIQPSVNQLLFSFSVIGDPESDIENLQKSLSLSKAKQASFVVLVGDLTSTGTPEQLGKVKQTLDASGLKYNVIPGNHDLWYGREVCNEKKAKNQLDTCTNTDTFNEIFGNNFFHQIIKEYNFLYLDNSDEWLGFGEKQLDWLDKQFLIFNFKFLIFSHIPLYYPGSEYIMGNRSEMVKKEATDLLKKLCETKPMAVFFGHLHYAKNYEYTCGNGNKLPMATAGSINRDRNAQLPKFLKVDIFSDNSYKIEEVILP